MNYVTFIIRNLENVPGKSGVGQGEVREKSGNFFCQSLWEPCVETRDQNSRGCPLLFSNRNLGSFCA